MKHFLYLLFAVTLVLTAPPASLAQTGIGGSPHPSAVLDLKSANNDKAFYPPRLTSAQRRDLPNPQAGAFLYDTERSKMFLFDGQDWLPLLTTDPAQSAPINQTADDGATGDSFGSSVSISGDYAIVGAPNKSIADNPNLRLQGVAYVFMRSGNGWIQQQRLTGDDLSANVQFGTSVAISGDYIVVGAPGKTVVKTQQGAAYVFVRSGSSWTLQQRLAASDGATADNLGTSVDISGNYVILGTGRKTIDGKANQGVAYIFAREGTNWTQQSRLIANDGQAGDFFGRSVAISGDYAMIGATNKTITTPSQGAVYMFTRNDNNWTQQQRITASDGATGDVFGSSVAISGDYAIVGANGKSISQTKQGATYIFQRSENVWNEQLRLTASDAAANDFFGSSVALSGNYAIVGALGKVIDGASQGASYVFKRTGTDWNQRPRISETSQGVIRNGFSVDLDNETFIIGGNAYQGSKGKVGFVTVN